MKLNQHQKDCIEKAILLFKEDSYIESNKAYEKIIKDGNYNQEEKDTLKARFDSYYYYDLKIANEILNMFK